MRLTTPDGVRNVPRRPGLDRFPAAPQPSRERAFRREYVRRGGVALWLVVSLSVLIGILALLMDGGRMLEERRRVQGAADAAALAAAWSLFDHYSQDKGTDPNGTAKQAALKNAEANGYKNNDDNPKVTVNIPPTSGDFAGQAAFAEVIIETSVPGSFSAIFTQQPVRLRARAVALGRPQRIGLIMLKPSGSNSLLLDGNAQIQVGDAPIIVNSNDPVALQISGNAVISAASHDVTGGYQADGLSIIGPIRTNVPPSPDPLAGLPEPQECNYPLRATAQTNISGVKVLEPGVYRGGISVSGAAVVTLLPGVYIMDGGGFQVSGGAVVTGQEVMIFNTGTCDSGQIKFSGSGAVTLTAPLSGTYRGISIFQSRNLTKTINVSGNGSIAILGLIYAPAAHVELSGNGSTSANTMGGAYIASSMRVSGNGTVAVQLGSNRPRVPQVCLVE